MLIHSLIICQYVDQLKITIKNKRPIKTIICKLVDNSNSRRLLLFLYKEDGLKMKAEDLPFGELTLNAAGILCYLLFSQKDEEERCILLASCLRVLSVVADNTDAYEPIRTVADQIHSQAERNIEARNVDDSIVRRDPHKIMEF